MRIALPAALALALVQAGSARAEPTADEQAAARLLFYEGRKLAQAGDYQAACPKLEQAMKLDPGTGTLFNLADCWEHTGRTASAWAGFRDVAVQSAAANRPDRESEARRRASDLEPKLARLVIRVAEGQPDGLEIRRDDAPVPRSVWGIAVPLDPGKHVVTATASGHAPFRGTAELVQEGATITLDVPKLSPLPAGSVAQGAAATTTPRDAQPAERRWQRPLAVGVGAVGVVGLAAGTVVGLMAKSKKDDSDADGHCQGDVCDDIGFPIREDAVAMGNVATVVFVGGAVFVAAGAVLWFTAPSSSASAKATSVGVTPTGLVVRGSF
jgi:serine/threonine-protein kinase